MQGRDTPARKQSVVTRLTLATLWLPIFPKMGSTYSATVLERVVMISGEAA
jgi:hypothetical protein